VVTRDRAVNRARIVAAMDSRKIALIVYRVMAYVTGTGLVILVCIAMPIRYLPWFGHNSQPVAIVGALHGFLYMIYVVSALVLAERCRWKPVYALLVAAAGTIPFVSFYAERKVTHKVRNTPPPRPRRRPRPAGERAGSAAERAADQQTDLNA
jgi:integral membrane protein